MLSITTTLLMLIAGIFIGSSAAIIYCDKKTPRFRLWIEISKIIIGVIIASVGIYSIF